MLIDAEFHTLDAHLFNATVDVHFFKFEVGNAIPQKATNSIIFFEYHHVMSDTC